MRNVLDEDYEENKDTHFMFTKFFSVENRAVYDNMEKYRRARQATDHSRTHAHCMLDTNTHSKYVILITFTLQQWLHERASKLLYPYIACLVITEVGNVYRAIRTGSLNKTDFSSPVKG
jgi:glycosidase